MRFLLAAVAALLLLPAVAHAAPPANDARSAPRAVSLPSSVTGTTVDSTVEADEPPACGALKGSVWYSLTAPDATRIVLRLANAGDLDGTLDVFLRTRSQLTPVNCQLTDADGTADLSFKPVKGASYLIRVGQRTNSVPGTFQLSVAAPLPAPTAPGPGLPPSGVSHTLDSVQDTADAFSVTMRAGRSYRINLSQPDGGCVSLAIYPPGTKGSFEDADPVRTLRCGGYVLYTPDAGEGGTYSLLASARSSKRGPQPYHLQFAAAGPDDSAPGLPIANYQRIRGALSATTDDAVDLYRFTVAKRSDVRLTLAGGHDFELQLLSQKGGRIDESDEGEIEVQMRPGRYYVAVRASGRASGGYTLERAARTITRTTVALPTRSAPGAALTARAKVSPSASGPVRFTIERFDPLAGWLFFRQVTVSASGGSASYSFVPTGEGRWRATASFLGTRTDAPSDAGFSTALVAGTL